MSNDPNTRRVSERYLCDFTIWLTPEGGEFHGELMLVSLQNISAGGLLCNLECTLTMGQNVSLSISLPQWDNLVHVDGIVRHISETDDDYMIGIEFTEVKDIPPQAFRAYIEALFV